ncbi:MAG: hypothetical protein LBP42_08405 [Treponema sp.]|jgi:hypothetical protein|nr:hypothetical protein [Treponema sp.]
MYLDEYNMYQSIEQALLEYQNRQIEEPGCLSEENFRGGLPVYILAFTFAGLFTLSLLFCVLTGL